MGIRSSHWQGIRSGICLYNASPQSGSSYSVGVLQPVWSPRAHFILCPVWSLGDSGVAVGVLIGGGSAGTRPSKQPVLNCPSVLIRGAIDGSQLSGAFEA